MLEPDARPAGFAERRSPVDPVASPARVRGGYRAHPGSDAAPWRAPFRSRRAAAIVPYNSAQRAAEPRIKTVRFVTEEDIRVARVSPDEIILLGSSGAKRTDEALDPWDDGRRQRPRRALQIPRCIPRIAASPRARRRHAAAHYRLWPHAPGFADGPLCCAPGAQSSSMTRRAAGRAAAAARWTPISSTSASPTSRYASSSRSRGCVLKTRCCRSAPLRRARDAA